MSKELLYNIGKERCQYNRINFDFGMDVELCELNEDLN